MTYIGDISYYRNMIRYDEFRCMDMDAIECRYSWSIKGIIYYSCVIYTIEYWINHKT